MLNTVHLSTASAFANVLRTSIRFCHAAFFAIRPRIQRRLQPGMARRCLFGRFTADYVHSSLEGKVRKLRTYSSQTANCQGGRQKGGLMLALYPLLVSG